MLKIAVTDSISNTVHKQNSKSIDATVKVFRIVYRPLSGIEGEIELQETNVAVSCLNTRYSATRITEHNSKERKVKIFKNIMEEKAKICIIIGEAPTVSEKSTLLT